jgi:hypothetical protein
VASRRGRAGAREPAQQLRDELAERADVGLAAGVRVGALAVFIRDCERAAVRLAPELGRLAAPRRAPRPRRAASRRSPRVAHSKHATSSRVWRWI